MSKIYIDEKGYKRFNKSGKLVHRRVMEKKLGLRLRKDVIVHHINGIKTDNRFKNLQLMTRKEHFKHHVVSKDTINFSTLLEIIKVSLWTLRLLMRLIINTAIYIFKVTKGYRKYR